ncbi:hypothetical protein D0Z07_9206 [Hyphodiscus hymeniophilus]|uniref:Uncharacterized protein n=1 Tax=Hyphodiscus hymeniophilus TaxID=353542 RepID=A0A9P6SMN0_9HELO|nr:hypothetical protein D0Z07_9206 [Hyphodiscus hymeniophilus]
MAYKVSHKLTIINHDISLFLEYNLGTIRQEWSLGADWPGEVVLKQLVLHACGLFIWAATTCRFIREGKRFARTRLDTILKASSSAVTAPEKHLNEIYLAVLKHSISSEYSEEEKEYHSGIALTSFHLLIKQDIKPSKGSCRRDI